MRITEELREWWARKFPVMDKELHEDFTAIADRIDAEHERAMAESWDNGYESDFLGIEQWLTEHPQVMEHHGWVQLPKDADGEVWRLGDELMMEGEVCEVVGIGGKTIFYAFGDGVEWTIAHNNRHHHAPTVEDVLREFAVRVAGDECMTMRTDVITEFAARLQLRGEDA